MISDNDITSDESLGVTKKLLGQYKAFNKLGYDTYHLCFKDERGVLIHKDTTTVIVKKQLKMYLTYIKLLNAADRICLENKIDMCYIRYPLADFAFMKMIKKLHKICKVVIEIPTYPYDNEMVGNVGMLTKLNFKQDLKNRHKLKKYVDFISTFSNEKETFGIPCININNGIDIDTAPFIEREVTNDNTLRIISVSLMRSAHRFDRLITGLKNYYDTKKAVEPDVFFDVVGPGVGNEKERLENITKDNNLEKYVLFHGIKSGEELDILFKESHIAVATLKGDCVKGETASVLKTREYCARGIPFISSVPDNAIPNGSVFCKLVKSCDDPIDIREIIDYFQFVKQHPDIPAQMRKFAEENLTWEPQLKKVIGKF